jgi:hypothetical protein
MFALSADYDRLGGVGGGGIHARCGRGLAQGMPIELHLTRPVYYEKPAIFKPLIFSISR